MFKDYLKSENCCCDCCCDNCCNPVLPTSFESEYAFLSQSGRLYNTGLFGGINLNNENVMTDGFAYDTGIITIINAGIYIATYFVTIPSNAIVNTNLVIQLNNQSLVGSSSRINKTTTESSVSAAGQAIFRINDISALRVSSSSIIDINAPNSSDTVASLTIIKIAE